MISFRDDTILFFFKYIYIYISNYQDIYIYIYYECIYIYIYYECIYIYIL